MPRKAELIGEVVGGEKLRKGCFGQFLHLSSPCLACAWRQKKKPDAHEKTLSHPFRLLADLKVLAATCFRRAHTCEKPGRPKRPYVC